MKHGVAFRKFSRTSSHRMLMLRNLVTSLIEHEQIKTTLPKAKDAARLAEKIITLGKQGDLPAARRAQGFILKPTLIPKLFGLLASRYANRPGGYTRIHKFGHRFGDNAPHAVLELVDNPRDLRFDMTARAVGWELYGKSLVTGSSSHKLMHGVGAVEKIIRREKGTGTTEFIQEGVGQQLRLTTQANLKKVLRYRGTAGVKELSVKTQAYINQLMAESRITSESVKEEDGEKIEIFKDRPREFPGPAGGDFPDKLTLAAEAYASARQRLLAGSRPVQTSYSPYKASSKALSRQPKGLGLPGANWYERERLKRQRVSSRT